MDILLLCITTQFNDGFYGSFLTSPLISEESG